jgi:galactokinase
MHKCLLGVFILEYNKLNEVKEGERYKMEATFFTPGRINIIGEHIDYNGGYVLPCTIKEGTTVKIKKRGDNTARFISTNIALEIEVPLTNITYDPAHGWANYPKGVLRHMQMDGHTLGGFDAVFSGTIPNGAGLSSSASLLVAMATALNEVFSLGYEKLAIVKLAQQVENQFCGVNCGIMDQFAVGMGNEKSAIYLHCGTLDYKYVPLNLGEYAFVIMNTNKRRELADSKYNERRAECEEALAFMQKGKAVQHLADFSPQELHQFSQLIPHETLRKRAKHVVLENDRVKQAVLALENGDVKKLSALLVQSHASLRDDYEVTGIELDTIVAEALKNPACIGARMTGAGFGGCAIALVEKDKIEAFVNNVSAAYTAAIGYAPDIF